MSDHQGRRLGHRSEVQPCALGQRRGAGLAGHEHVVTGPLTSMRERHEWAEVTRRAGTGKQDPHDQGDAPAP